MLINQVVKQPNPSAELLKEFLEKFSGINRLHLTDAERELVYKAQKIIKAKPDKYRYLLIQVTEEYDGREYSFNCTRRITLRVKYPWDWADKNVARKWYEWDSRSEAPKATSHGWEFNDPMVRVHVSRITELTKEQYELLNLLKI